MEKAESREERNEQERRRLRDPSFIDPAVQDRAAAQNDVSSPESDALIGPRPLHGPATMTRSGLTVHPASHS